MYMNYIVSITSQGQLTVPAQVRRELGLDKKKRAIVSVKKGKMEVSSVKDFLALGGSLKTTRKASIKEIREAFEKDLATRSAK